LAQKTSGYVPVGAETNVAGREADSDLAIICAIDSKHTLALAIVLTSIGLHGGLNGGATKRA
jgi:hypothetical protein